MMNRKKRMKNRATARQLHRDIAPPCPNCGVKGRHWVGIPMTLADLFAGTEQDGFWICDKYYGADGHRLADNAEITGLQRAAHGSDDEQGN